MLAQEEYYYEEQEVLEQRIVKKKVKKQKFANKLITILIVTIFGIFIIFQQANISKQQKIMYGLQQKLNDSKAANEGLSVALSKATTLDAITKSAQTKYGMQVPENGQIVKITLKASKYTVKGSKMKNTSGLIGKLLKIFSK